uniref:hypothetical protein n=1 Tax=Pontiella sp. TaxID=2837462 RepID=UPI003568F14C
MINPARILKREILRSWWLLGLFAVLLGCSEKASEPVSLSEPAYSRQYRAGALTVIVSLSETNIPSSGKITALLEVHAPAGIDPVFPNLGNAIDPFAIADTYSEPAQALPNGKRLYRQVWMLVPGLPGRTEFQSLEIRAGDERLETEPVTVTVTSLLPPDTEELALRDIAAPIEQLPEQQNKRRSLYTLIGTLLVLALIPFVIHL